MNKLNRKKMLAVTLTLAKNLKYVRDRLWEDQQTLAEWIASKTPDLVASELSAYTLREIVKTYGIRFARTTPAATKSQTEFESRIQAALLEFADSLAHILGLDEDCDDMLKKPIINAFCESSDGQRTNDDECATWQECLDQFKEEGGDLSNSALEDRLGKRVPSANASKARKELGLGKYAK
jgi:hypothetical protein